MILREQVPLPQLPSSIAVRGRTHHYQTIVVTVIVLSRQSCSNRSELRRSVRPSLIESIR